MRSCRPRIPTRPDIPRSRRAACDHTFQIIKADGSPGARKDTAIVLARQNVGAALLADNPGIWMLHCHNTYHQTAGMMTSLNYTA